MLIKASGMIYNFVICAVITIACSLSAADWKGDSSYSAKVEKFLDLLEGQLPGRENHLVTQVDDGPIFFGSFKKIVIGLLNIYSQVHAPTNLKTENISDLLKECINKLPKVPIVPKVTKVTKVTEVTEVNEVNEVIKVSEVTEVTEVIKVTEVTEDMGILLRELDQINKDKEIKSDNKRYWFCKFIKELNLEVMNNNNFATNANANANANATTATATATATSTTATKSTQRERKSKRFNIKFLKSLPLKWPQKTAQVLKW